MISLAGAAPSIIFVATKHVFCRDKSVLAATKRLSRQNVFVATKLLSRQIFVAINTCLCRNKHTFVATKHLYLSRQTKDLFCRDKHVIILVAAPANDRIRLVCMNWSFLTLIRVYFELTRSSESNHITSLRTRFILLSGLFLTSVILVQSRSDLWSDDTPPLDSRLAK